LLDLELQLFQIPQKNEKIMNIILENGVRRIMNLIFQYYNGYVKHIENECIIEVFDIYYINIQRF
jgi:hypothetical protein